MLRGGLVTLAFMGLSLAAGHGGRADVAVVLAGSSVFYFLWPAMAAWVDRQEGGLEFLLSVPVSPQLVAWARLTGIAIALLPCAVYLTVAFVIAVGPELGVQPAPESTLAVFLLSWLFTTGLSAFLSGVFIRWGFDVLNRWPALLAILAVGALGLVFDRHVEAIHVFLTGLVARAGWVSSLVVLVILVSVLSLGLGHSLMATGLARFTPDRGRLKA